MNKSYGVTYGPTDETLATHTCFIQFRTSDLRLLECTESVNAIAVTRFVHSSTAWMRRRRDACNDYENFHISLRPKRRSHYLSLWLLHTTILRQRNCDNSSIAMRYNVNIFCFCFPTSKHYIPSRIAKGITPLVLINIHQYWTMSCLIPPFMKFTYDMKLSHTYCACASGDSEPRTRR